MCCCGICCFILLEKLQMGRRKFIPHYLITVLNSILLSNIQACQYFISSSNYINMVIIIVLYILGNVNIFKVKAQHLPGTNYQEISSLARHIFREMQRKTKRKMHVRSAYFKKQKVFFDFFWNHLLEKSLKERTLRLKFLPCTLELIQYSFNKPEETHNTENGKRELLYRFFGETPNGKHFIVQIKRLVKKNTLQCISIFPIK